MSRFSCSIAGLTSLCLLLSSVPAVAQDAATAEVLFREGKALMAEGNYDEACPKFEASQRLDPAVGTLMNLADCNDKIGKTASAWAQFIEAATLSRRAGFEERENVASARAKSLEPRLMRISVRVPEDARIDGLEVRRDGELLPPAAWGIPTPVDPGPHLVSATAPGHKEWAKAFDLHTEGETTKVDVPRLDEGVDKPDPEKPAAPVTTERVPPPRPVVAETDPGASQRTIGIVVGGVGLVGIAVGSVFGLSARSKWSDANCPDNRCLTKNDQSLAEDAKSNATLSTVGFAAGGGLLVAGAVLYFTAPSGRERVNAGVSLVPSLTRDAGGLHFIGAF